MSDKQHRHKFDWQHPIIEPLCIYCGLNAGDYIASLEAKTAALKGLCGKLAKELAEEHSGCLARPESECRVRALLAEAAKLRGEPTPKEGECQTAT